MVTDDLPPLVDPAGSAYGRGMGPRGYAGPRPARALAVALAGVLVVTGATACSAEAPGGTRTRTAASTPTAPDPSTDSAAPSGSTRTGEPPDAGADPTPDGETDPTPDAETDPTPDGETGRGSGNETDPGTDPPAGPERAVSVTVVGDIMLGRGVADVARAAGDPSAPLRPMAERLARADITVGNFESTLSDDGAPRQGDDSFSSPPSVLDGLRAAGFDVLGLANNHTADYGAPALVETLRRVRASGIEPLGAGRDRREAWRPVLVERRGVRVGFLAFNAIGETYRAKSESPGAASLRMDPRTGPLRPDELRRVQDRVRTLAERADVVIVLPHWGDQYTHQPVPDQRRVGRALLDAGATIVVGGHPHWVQDVQRHRGGFVVHSLGNFVFDMDFSQQTQEGVVLGLTFRAGALVRTRTTPYVIGDDYAPRPVAGARGRDILGDMAGLGQLPP